MFSNPDVNSNCGYKNYKTRFEIGFGERNETATNINFVKISKHQLKSSFDKNKNIDLKSTFVILQKKTDKKAKQFAV